MSEYQDIKLTDLDKFEVRKTLKLGFLKEYNAYLNHQPYKGIMEDMSSGCAGCRRGAYIKALNLLKSKK